jgi:hypothetical protein
LSLWSRQNQFYISDQLLITKTFEIISDKLITRFILIWWFFFKHSPKLIITLIKAKPFCISDQLFINKTFEFFSDNNLRVEGWLFSQVLLFPPQKRTIAFQNITGILLKSSVKKNHSYFLHVWQHKFQTWSKLTGEP